MMTSMQLRALVAFATAGLAVAAVQADQRPGETQWRWTEVAKVVDAVPPLPPTTTFPVQLVLDDDGAEGSFGVSGQFARQFLWFNRFSPAVGFHLEQVWVLFPLDPNIAVGGAVQIAIYEDPDGDPTNGATLLTSFDTTIQAADGNTFSVYAVPGSPTIPTGSDLLVGVVPRFIASGVTPPTTPAALDTTSTQARSWLAVWSTDPPDPPVLLPLPDQTFTLVDAFVPGGGNWMIRAFGSDLAVTEIPTLTELGLAALALGLLAAGWLVLRRRSKAAGAAVLALLLSGVAVPATAVTIDTFTTNQATLSAPPDATSTATGGADIIGTRRGMVIRTLAGAGPSTVGVAGGNLTLTVTATTPDSRGEARLSWDADLTPLVLSPTGLVNADLTSGNASGLRLAFASTTVVTEVEITIYDDGTNFSRAARRVPVSASAQEVLIPFEEFRIASGDGADFASVGAIEMTVRGGEGTITLNEFTTTAATVAATKVDAQIVDNDGDTRVDPGDRVRYTVTVTNTGNQALAVDLTDTVDPNTTLVTGSVSSTPVAHNDQYGWFGNVTLVADGITPQPLLLANDVDADGDDLDVQSVVSPTAAGGTVSLDDAETGEFTYSPPAGFSGVDSFNYTVIDDNGNTSTATANIALDGVVWFVDDSNTTPPHLGTLADPFQALASVNSGSDPDQPGDILFVYDDDGSPYAGGLVLEADQSLLGEAAGLILGGTTIVPAGTAPQITNAGGAGITLAANNTLRGFDVSGTSGFKIAGSAFGTLTLDTVNLAGGGGALDLDNGVLAATFGTIASTSGVNGIDFDAVTGAFSATSTAVSGISGTAIRIANGASSATYGFGSTTINAPAGVDITASATTTTSFASMAVTATAGKGINAFNGGTINIAGAGNTVTATGTAGINAAALDISFTSLGSGATFASASSTTSGSGGNGINLTSVTGPVTINGGSITGAVGTAFRVQGGAGNISYSGSITNTTGAAVDITSRTGGTVTLSGNINDTGSGIIVANCNLGGSPAINFSGSTKSLSTGTFGAVTLSNNSSATINFTGGGLAITTTSGSGFNAYGGAAAISVQGAGNTISSTTGTALNVASSTIGANGLTFQSIAANGATNGIALSSTGSLGGLTVTGTGAVNSGGTIQNTTGVGILLASARNVDLTRMLISGTGSHGVSGIGLATSNANPSFALRNSRITSPGDADGETALFFGNSTTPGNSTGQILIADTIVEQFEDFGLTVFNASGALTVDVTGTRSGTNPNFDSTMKFDDNSDTHGESAIVVTGTGSANLTINITGVFFNNVEGSGLLASIGGDVPAGAAAMDVDVIGCAFNGAGGPDNFPNPAYVALGARDQDDLTFRIQGNFMLDSREGVVITGDGDVTGSIGGTGGGEGNVITGVAFDAVRVDMDGIFGDTINSANFTWTIAIRNNTLTGSPGNTNQDDGIQILNRDHVGMFNLTIENNVVSDFLSEGVRYFGAERGSPPQGDTNARVRIANNTFTNTAFGVGELDILLRMTDSAVACFDITGNTGSAPWTINFEETETSDMNVVQASQAAVGTGNGSATMSSTGTAPDFGQPCVPATP